jgi:hypothetical protein
MVSHDISYTVAFRLLMPHPPLEEVVSGLPAIPTQLTGNLLRVV